MNKINSLITGSSLALLLVLNGCGSSTNPTVTDIDDDTKDKKVTPYKSKTLPTDISLKIPKALKGSRASEGFKRNRDILFDGQSMGYIMLKNDIEMAEESIAELKLNLYFLDTIMDEINEKCKNTKLNETCTISASSVDYTLDEAILEGAKEIIDENSLTDFEAESIKNEMEKEKGKSFSLGEILYTKYDSNHTFENKLQVDMSLLDNTVIKDIEIFKWSNDKNKIEIQNDLQESDGYQSTMSLAYVKKDNGEKEMHIFDKFEDDSFTLDVVNKNDQNHTTIVTSKHTFDKFTNIVTSKIDDNGGYMVTSGSDELGEFKEKESFDGNGTLLKSAFCFAGLGCDVNDESTWISDDADIFQIADDSFDGFFNMLQIEDSNLTIVSGSLVDGNYIFLSDDANIDSNNSHINFFDVIENEVGGFVISDGNITDFMPFDMNVSKINDYTLVEEENVGYEVLFKAVPVDQKPIFSIN